MDPSQPPTQQAGGFMFATELFTQPPSSNTSGQGVIPDFQPFLSNSEGFVAPVDSSFYQSDSVPQQPVYRETSDNMAARAGTKRAHHSGNYPPFWYEEPETEDGDLTETEETPRRPRPSKIPKISHPTAVKTERNVQSTTFTWIREAMDHAFDEPKPFPCNTAKVIPAVISPAARNEGRASVLKKRKRGDTARKAVDEYEAYGELPSYPPSSDAIPDNMPMQTICRERPNHLIGKHLDAFIQRMFTGLDIYNLLPDKAVKEFIEKGVMSSQHKNRANFLTKRLNKRMNIFTPETMKALIEGPKIRPCNDDGSEKLGGSKLQGKYMNKQAQPVRSMPRRKYNGLSAAKKAIKEREAAVKKEAERKEAPATIAEEESEVIQQTNDNIPFNGESSATPLAPTPPSPTLPEPMGLYASAAHLDHTDFYGSKHWVHYSAAMADRWNQQKFLGETVLALDLYFCDPQSPGRDEMLAQMGLWPVNAETLALVDYHDGEDCPTFSGLICNLFTTAFNNNLPTQGSMDKAQLDLLREQTVSQILAAQSNQTAVLEDLVARGRAGYMIPTEGFAYQALYGSSTTGISTETLDGSANAFDTALNECETLQDSESTTTNPNPELYDSHIGYPSSELHDPQYGYPITGQYDPQYAYPSSGQYDSLYQYPSLEVSDSGHAYPDLEEHSQVLAQSPGKGKKRARDDEVADAPRKRARGF